MSNSRKNIGLISKEESFQTSMKHNIIIHFPKIFKVFATSNFSSLLSIFTSLIKRMFHKYCISLSNLLTSVVILKILLQKYVSIKFRLKK